MHRGRGGGFDRGGGGEGGGRGGGGGRWGGSKKYEEPGPRGSAADFLLGEEMEGDPSGREEVQRARLPSLPQRTNHPPFCAQPSNSIWPTSQASALLWGKIFLLLLLMSTLLLTTSKIFLLLMSTLLSTTTLKPLRIKVTISSRTWMRGWRVSMKTISDGYNADWYEGATLK